MGLKPFEASECVVLGRPPKVVLVLLVFFCSTTQKGSAHANAEGSKRCKPPKKGPWLRQPSRFLCSSACRFLDHSPLFLWIQRVPRYTSQPAPVFGLNRARRVLRPLLAAMESKALEIMAEGKKQLEKKELDVGKMDEESEEALAEEAET